MTNAISKLHRALETWSTGYNCYESVHPWTPFCTDSALEVGATVFGEAFKLYTPLYLRKYDPDSFKRTAKSIFRSTLFISANTFFALFFFCSTRYMTGKFYYHAVAYLPCFVASLMAVLIEKPGRRASLAFYVSNVASETLYRIHVGRGHIQPLKHGQVYLFTLSIATLMMLAKKHGFEDDPLSTAIKLIVGPEVNCDQRLPSNELFKLQSPSGKEPEAHMKNDCSRELFPHDDCEKSTRNKVTSTRLINLLYWLRSMRSPATKFLTSKHPLCPHQDCTCLNYALKASLRALLIGYGLQLGPRLLAKAALIMREPTTLASVATETGALQFGLFLASFSGLFKATNCWLRQTSQTSAPRNSFIAGLVAGPSLLLYPSPTVALYVLWKCLEALFNVAAESGAIRNKDFYIVLLYSSATSQLFYSALMDPQYLKRSYMSFMNRMSHQKLQMINRSVLDVFGTQASKGFEDFFPDLQPKYMSRAFLGSVWIWMIEQKLTVNQVRD